MRTILSFLFMVGVAQAAQGDINGDGGVGLEEAIYALQVTAGQSVQPPVTTSQLLAVKDGSGTVVGYHLDSHFYLSLSGYVFTAENKSYKPVNWVSTPLTGDHGYCDNDLITNILYTPTVFFSNPDCTGAVYLMPTRHGLHGGAYPGVICEQSAEIDPPNGIQDRNKYYIPKDASTISTETTYTWKRELLSSDTVNCEATDETVEVYRILVNDTAITGVPDYWTYPLTPVLP